LDALLRQDASNIDYRIIVVDNSPSEDQANHFASGYSGSPVKFLWTQTPGLSNARNIGAKNCETDVIAYIDDDAICDQGWAVNLLTAYRELGSSCGVVGGKSYPIWLGEQPEWIPLGKLGLLSMVDLGDEIRFIQDGEWLAGVNISFLTRLLIDSDGFDTSLGRTGGDATLLSNEETRLVNKLKAKGVQVGYTPHASVGHCVDPMRLTPQWFRKRVVWQAISDYLVDSSMREIKITNWPWVNRTIYAAHPRHRNINYFLRNDCSATEVTDQLDILYTFIYSALAGFSDFEEIA
jgi:glycosyltransferase involved in cell wall biosynthesis